MKHFLIILTFFPKFLSNEGIIESVTKTPNLVSENDIVTLTTYVPNQKETDSSPHITASGFKIDTTNPKKHRIIAISRDLKRKWGFNKKVRIRKAGKYNGVYTIKDVMNKRFKKRVDILVDSDDKPVKLDNVQISLVK